MALKNRYELHIRNMKVQYYYAVVLFSVVSIFYLFYQGYFKFWVLLALPLLYAVGLSIPFVSMQIDKMGGTASWIPEWKKEKISKKLVDVYNKKLVSSLILITVIPFLFIIVARFLG